MVKIINNLCLCAAFCSALVPANNLHAKEIEMNTAKLQAMDKITGRVSVLEAPVNSIVNFGSFSILVRACKTRPPEEAPDNFAFVDVVDVNQNNQQTNIFKGWMISSSPALHAVEHPIYDVWLLSCLNTNVDKSKLLNEEQLKARDEIPQQQNIELTDTLSENDENLTNSVMEISSPDEEDNQSNNSENTQNELPSEEKLSDTAPLSDDGGPVSLINIPEEALNDMVASEEASSQPENNGNDVLPENSIEEISETKIENSADNAPLLSDKVSASEIDENLKPQEVKDENASPLSSDNQTLSITRTDNEQASDRTDFDNEKLIQKDDVQFIEFNVEESIAPELNADALNI